ncbi:hypothetical protein ACFXD5_01945 [Streptomyces sp. NPDC059385]|uniref:hypothetical protein n=1 Tax=Streptomyces sp. NPDC059385 TaxID=3346817 RepID=UPI0036BF5706
MDLDLAGARLDLHRQWWLAEGLSVSPVLWRRRAGSRVSAERGPVPAVEGVAVRVAGPDWGVTLSIELQFDGMAVLAYLASLGWVEERVRVGSLDVWDALLDDAVQRASRLKVRHAQLLAASCTTGWLDWVHGALWLLPDSLVRVRGGFVDTVVNSIASGVPEQTATGVIGYDPVAILGGHRTNKVIPFDGIAHARLHTGLTTSGLAVTMADGTRHRLLWLSSEPARRILTDRLLPVLGSRLIR